MELLVGLIAEILLVIMAPCLAIIGAIAGAFLELVLSILASVFGITFARTKASPDTPAPEPAKPTTPRRRIWRYVLITPVVLVIGALFVINQFYFAPTMRWVADFAAERAGYRVDIGSIDGDLWQGRLDLTEVEVTGHTPDGTYSTAMVETFAVDLAVLSLMTRNVRIDALHVEDVEVDVRRTAATSDKDRQTRGRSFAVEKLTVIDAEMRVTQPDGSTHELIIKTAEAAPLRSNWAVFDLLFRSNLDASLDGADLIVKTSVIDGQGRQTEWELERLDLKTLAAFTDAAPVRWFGDGHVSANMQDRWRRDDITINSAWQLRLRDAKIDPARINGMTETVLAGALAEVLTDRRGDVDLEFRLVLDENGFRDSASGDLTAWWNAMLRGLARAVAAYDGSDSAETEGRLRGFTKGVRDILGIERE